MKGRKKWRRIGVDDETKNLIERPIVDSSQMQIDSNEAYTIDLDGNDHKSASYSRLRGLQTSGLKQVNKSQNIQKKSKNFIKSSVEMGKVKRMVKGILARKALQASGKTSSGFSTKSGDNDDQTDIFDDDVKSIQIEPCYESNLILPTGGQSYNPCECDHQNHLLVAAEQIELENRHKRVLDPENYLKPMTAKLKELLPHLEIDNLQFKTKQRLMFILAQNDIENKADLINECISNDGVETSDFTDPVIPAVPRSKRSQKRKTQSDRNRKERAKILKSHDKERGRIKNLNKNIDKLDELIKQSNEQDKIKNQRKKNRELVKKLAIIMKRKGLLMIKQSNKRYFPESIKDVALIDELPRCLRHVKPISGVKILQNQLIEKGLINLPPEIDKQYQAKVKYDLYVKNNAARFMDRARDFNVNSKDQTRGEAVEAPKTESNDKITSLI